jgi:hypothetical protein
MELQQYISELETQILKENPHLLLHTQLTATQAGLDDKSYADYLVQLYFDKDGLYKCQTT